MLRPPPLLITCALTNIIANDVSRPFEARRASDVYCALKSIGLTRPMPLVRKTAQLEFPTSTFGDLCSIALFTIFF